MHTMSIVSPDMFLVQEPSEYTVYSHYQRVCVCAHVQVSATVSLSLQIEEEVFEEDEDEEEEIGGCGWVN